MSDKYVFTHETLTRMEKRTQFRSISRKLMSEGMNVWDARIQARRILNIQLYEFIRKPRPRFRPRGFVPSSGRYSPIVWPTKEEFLEVQFWDIVGMLKSIVSGNLTPRPLSQFAESWSDNFNNTRNFSHYEVKEDSIEDKRVIDTRPRYTPVSKEEREFRKRVNKMEKIFVANGMSLENANIQARLILGR